MFSLPPADRSKYVNQTFSRIAGRYDQMNRLMTAGMDIQWRKEVIDTAAIPPNGKVLDIGTGTGDLARAISKKAFTADITAADFTLEMMTARQEWQGINRCTADALNLPFNSEAFDRIISGFLMRNVADVKQSLHEQFRVLKPGGRIVILDTTRPRANLFSPFVRFYLKRVIPFLGTLITGDKEAYTYLPESTRNFLRAEDLAAAISEAGFINVTFRIRMFGTIAIHSAEKKCEQLK